MHSLLVEDLAEIIPGFNERSLTLSDLEPLCLERNIEFVIHPMKRLHGIAMHEEGYDFLHVNSLVSPAEQIIAGFHEFEHFLFDNVEEKICQSLGRLWNLSKQERRAQTVGVMALMPVESVWRMSIEEMMGEYQVSRQIAEFRYRLFKESGI